MADDPRGAVEPSGGLLLEVEEAATGVDMAGRVG